MRGADQQDFQRERFPADHFSDFTGLKSVFEETS